MYAHHIADCLAVLLQHVVDVLQLAVCGIQRISALVSSSFPGLLPGLLVPVLYACGRRQRMLLPRLHRRGMLLLSTSITPRLHALFVGSHRALLGHQVCHGKDVMLS
jgi:hypothetical protein